MSEGISAETFLTHQLAELRSASTYRIWTILVQLSIATVAAASVFVDGGAVLVALAILGALLVLIWLWLDHAYRSHKSAGDQARRIVLIASGLGTWPGGIGGFLGRFNARTEDVPPTSIDEYFASRAPAGNQRVAEMIEESAFFTGHLHHMSSRLMLLFVSLVVLAFVFAWLSLSFAMNDTAMMTTARVFLAFLVFLLSSELSGTIASHHSAGEEMTRIKLRIDAARARGYDHADTMLLVADYNAAVEAAPMVLPKLYELEKKKLNRTWAAYKSMRKIGDSVDFVAADSRPSATAARA